MLFRLVILQVVVTCKKCYLVRKYQNFIYSSVSFKSTFVRKYPIEIIIIWPIMITMPLIESRIVLIVFSYILAFVSYNIVLYPVMSEKVGYEL